MRRGAPQILHRPDDGRVVAGVCAGIAERAEIDVTLVRIGFAVLALASGLGIAVYAGLWIALPGPDAAGRPLRERFSRPHLRGELARTRVGLSRAWQRSDPRSAWPRPADRRWIAIGVIALGTVITLASFGAFGWLTLPRAVGLALVAMGASALVTLTGQGSRR